MRCEVTRSWKTAFSVEEDPSTKSFFSEIIGSISDMKYSMDGRYILTRDFMTMKLWDVAMERQPVKTVRIHEYLRPRLCDLYENDCIFDKFECAINHDGTFVFPPSAPFLPAPFLDFEMHTRLFL